jgi:hypothetical protein
MAMKCVPRAENGQVESRGSLALRGMGTTDEAEWSWTWGLRMEEGAFGASRLGLDGDRA